MRVVAGFGLLIVLSALSSSAQSAPAPGNSTAIRPGAMNTLCESRWLPNDGKHAKGSSETTCVNVFIPGCPVDMHVRQGMGGAMMAVDENGRKRLVFAPRLRLLLNDLNAAQSGKQIVAATVTVHGSSGKEHIQPADDASDARPDLKSSNIKRTLTVDLAEWGEPGVSGDFRLPGFTSTERVDLETITYDDGSIWKLSGGESCHVAPDWLMLINH